MIVRFWPEVAFVRGNGSFSMAKRHCSPSSLVTHLLTYHDPIPAAVLAGVEGSVGLVDQGVQVGVLVEATGDADGDGQAVVGHRLHHLKLADLLLQALRHHQRVPGVGVRQGDDELLAAEAADHVLGAQGVLAGLSDRRSPWPYPPRCR